MKRLFASLFVLSLATQPVLAGNVPRSAPAPAHEFGQTQIVAVVNDSVITTTDLAQRIRLTILSSGMPDSADVRVHLVPQILRGLIDEQLQMQEAKRLDLSVTKDEIAKALDKIAHDNHIPGDMKEYVESHGGSADALEAQIKAGLLWNKVVQHELRPKVDVGDDEIDAAVARIHADAGKEEYLVSEILLTVDNPKDDEQVHQVAENLVRQIKGGANFSAVARQFSQGSGAAQGGDIGWIQQGQLSAELNKALVGAEAGQILQPIRTSNGYHILGIREKRTVTMGDADKASVNLMQVFHPYGKDKDAVTHEAPRVKAAMKSCATLDADVSGFAGWKVMKLGDIMPAKAPPMIASKLSGLQTGQVSDVLSADKGAIILMVCSRNEGGDVDRDAILHSIGTEKLELQARRLLSDLRRAAYLDVRIGKDS